MTKILDVNDLCDAISDSTLDDAAQRTPIDALETTWLRSPKCWPTTTGSSPNKPNTKALRFCVNFYPAFEGQECPDVIDAGDEDGEPSRMRPH